MSIIAKRGEGKCLSTKMQDILREDVILRTVTRQVKGSGPSTYENSFRFRFEK